MFGAAAHMSTNAAIAWAAPLVWNLVLRTAPVLRNGTCLHLATWITWWGGTTGARSLDAGWRRFWGEAKFGEMGGLWVGGGPLGEKGWGLLGGGAIGEIWAGWGNPGCLGSKGNPTFGKGKPGEHSERAG